MKKFFYKFLIVTLAFGMLMPTWVTKMWVPTKAEAATVTVLNERFNNGTTSPTGWTFTNIGGTYTTAGNYGLASPSLQFDATGDRVTTASFQDADSLSFWVKGNGTDAVSSLLVEYYKSGIWSSLSELKPIPAVATTKTYPITAGTTQLRFTYTKSAGNLAFDDINITGAEPILTAEDFGVVNYNTGLGILKGYTAGFGLADATFEDVQSAVVKLYSDDTLLQTNTATSKVGEDITGNQISSPFDVSGNFDYATDGYWTNNKESEYGQTLPATRVEATVVLANGKTVIATNSHLVGDPTTIYPSVDIENPIITSISGNTANIGESTTITVLATDNIAPVSAMICFNGGAWENMTGNASSFTYVKNITLSTTPINYFVKVYDAAGNWAQSEEQTITVTDTRPIISNPNQVEKVVTAVATTAPSVSSSTNTGNSSSITPPSTVTPPVEQGEIKGAENTDDQQSEKINWTPWIILFILIILAGAATGGYFYWFGRDDEEEIVSKEVIEKSKKPVKNGKAAKSAKKSNRW